MKKPYSNRSAESVPNCMSYRRFCQLNGFFHANDNESPVDKSSQENKLVKVQKVINYLVNLFKTTYTPGKYISLDEGVMPHRGRWSFKTYNPDKPDK